MVLLQFDILTLFGRSLVVSHQIVVHLSQFLVFSREFLVLLVQFSVLLLPLLGF